MSNFRRDNDIIPRHRLYGVAEESEKVKRKRVKQNHATRNETWLAFSFLPLDLCTLWCVSPLPSFLRLPLPGPPGRPQPVSSVPALPSARLLPPLTSNSTRRIHRSVCAINPNNFKLKSLYVGFPFTYFSLASVRIIYIFFSLSLSLFYSLCSSRVTSLALTRQKNLSRSSKPVQHQHALEKRKSWKTRKQINKLHAIVCHRYYRYCYHFPHRDLRNFYASR